MYWCICFAAESVKSDARRSENLLIDFFAGTIAGMAGVIVGHPFDTGKWKNIILANLTRI